MDALISGQAGVAILLDGDKLFSVGREKPDIIVHRQEREINFLLGDAEDLELFSGIDLPGVVKQLHMSCCRVDALHLILILLDPEISPRTRQLAASKVETLFDFKYVYDFVDRLLHAHPLPGDSDLDGAKRSAAQKCGLTLGLLTSLETKQDIITEIHGAWELIPESSFGGEKEQAAAAALFAREGIFRDLVEARAYNRSLPEMFDSISDRIRERWPAGERVLLEWLESLDYPKASTSLTQEAIMNMIYLAFIQGLRAGVTLEASAKQWLHDRYYPWITRKKKSGRTPFEVWEREGSNFIDKFREIGRKASLGRESIGRPEVMVSAKMIESESECPFCPNVG
jgi:hypothetical protein